MRFTLLCYFDFFLHSCRYGKDSVSVLAWLKREDWKIFIDLQ